MHFFSHFISVVGIYINHGPLFFYGDTSAEEFIMST